MGAGTMGAGIAQVCLQAGHEVALYDVDEAARDRGRARIAEGLAKLAEKGRLASDPADYLARLRDAHTLEGLAQEADIVIEAALENIDLKRTIFRALGAAASPTAILATNTSALSVTEIAYAGGVPERSLGLHFFNPAPLMALVEVVEGDQTSAATMRAGLAFVEGLGKTAVACRDEPGFIVNRVNRPFTLEALRMLEGREASVEQIDAAIAGAGYPMGPFTLMDLVGIDVNYAVATALYDAFGHAERFRPSPIQEQLVSAGRLGRKSGEGFYRYTDGTPAVSDRLAEVGIEPPTDGGLPAGEIVERIEAAIINEAYHAAGDGVAEPPDVDRALKLGASHPRGPFERAGEIGLGVLIDRLAGYAAIHGERYRVAPALWQVASI
ncbi:MAG TPA: 3-hydroxyacyl-CoA dehydrogenase NAD-binding domain-containing protein [Candidatus Limnocylindrales bacterium]